MRPTRNFFFAFIGFIFFFQHASAGEDTHTSNVIINSDTTDQQTVGDGGDNVTLINNATINNGDDNASVQSFGTNTSNGLTGVTIINNSGATIKQDGGFDGTIKAQFNTNFTLTNSGTIQSNDGQAIDIKQTTNAIINNNSGGLITAKRNTIRCTASCTNPVVNNSGSITGSQEAAIRLDKSTGMIVNNKHGGLIAAEAAATQSLHAIDIGTNGSVNNSGIIRRTVNGEPGHHTKTAAIKFEQNRGTLTLKDDSILIGLISVKDGKEGNNLRIQHGYGRSYMYKTEGTLGLTDLDGNRIVAGSATSVGMGAQETVDELLGYRAYNLRASLKSYSNGPNSKKPKIEPFAYTSFRDDGRTTLGYENNAYGTNFIYPMLPDKLNLILTVERNKLKLDENHDITKKSFLAGISTNGFRRLNNWKASSYAVAGWSWHNSSRDVLTNIVNTGIADVSANYESAEVITGINFTRTSDQKITESMTNIQETELGITGSFSHTPSYSESMFFSWEERNLAQASIHFNKQLTLMIDDKVQLITSAEFEHRSVFYGKNQDHSLNAVTVDFNSGRYSENSVSMNTSFDYDLGEYGKIYMQFNGRLSDQTTIHLGGSAGVSIAF